MCRRCSRPTVCFPLGLPRVSALFDPGWNAYSRRTRTFDSCGEPTPVKTLGQNLILLSCVLIDPRHLKPAARIHFIEGYQMEFWGQLPTDARTAPHGKI